MTDDRLEQELRRRFGTLRAEVDRTTPAFRPPLRPVKRRGMAVWITATAALVVAVVGRLVFFSDERSRAYAIDLVGAYWTAPTDFLLDTPGLELLAEVPEIDINGFLPAPPSPNPETIDTVREPRRSQS